MQQLPSSMRSGNMETLFDLITNPKKYQAAVKELTKYQDDIKNDLGMLKTREQADKLKIQAQQIRNDADTYVTKEKAKLKQEQEDTHLATVLAQEDQATAAALKVAMLAAKEKHENLLSQLTTREAAFAKEMEAGKEDLHLKQVAYRERLATLQRSQDLWTERVDKIKQLMR